MDKKKLSPIKSPSSASGKSQKSSSSNSKLASDSMSKGTKKPTQLPSINKNPKDGAKKSRVEFNKTQAKAAVKPSPLKNFGRHARIERATKNENIKTMQLDPWSGNKVLPGIKTMLARFDDIIAGITDGLPSKPPSEVRIFVSSTFSDMRKERNSLVKYVFPKLKEFCYRELQLDFKIVDMRWGVTDDATNEHIAKDLCLEEIANCQRLSLGPNFVTILGQRYGGQFIPTKMSVKEFDLIQSEAEFLCHSHAPLLLQWYKRDDNAVPPLFILQSIRTHLPYFGDYSPGKDDLRKSDTARWWKILENLKSVVHEAAQSATQRGLMSKEKYHEFIQSVTETEVEKGILKARNQMSHTLAFIRRFDDLDGSKLSDKGADRHIDLIEDNGKPKINDHIKCNRDDLAFKKIPNKLGATHMSMYNIHWKAGGVDPSDSEHELYLKTFMSDFEKKLMTMIESAKNDPSIRILDNEYYTALDEILHHLHFCLEKCRDFRGQQKTLAEIQKYLQNPKNRKPLVLYGESGRGKTSLLAITYKYLTKWFGGGVFRIIRFLGTSPDSASIYDVLYSVLGQLADLADHILEPIGRNSMRAMIKYFPRFIRNISRVLKQPVFIFLDSIDQLKPTDGAYLLKWLPTELPANVYLIISTLPDAGDILANAKKILPDECFIEVEPLQDDTSIGIIQAMLERHNRTLSEEQMKKIMNSVQKSPSPLFLKLLMERAVKWHSFEDPSELVIQSSVREAINQLFQNLEEKYGSIFISHTLGYLTIGMNGLSEMELENALSCNDNVLNDIYQYHDPPVDGIVTIPSMLWARVRHDIKEYVVERLSNKKKTMFWYHRQFIEAAEARYTAQGKAKQLHSDLSVIYEAENGVCRDITLTKRSLNIAKADRQVMSQPLVSGNARKLLALPHHLLGSRNLQKLKKSVLCNLRFIMTKIQGISFAAIIRNFQDALEELGPDEEIELLLNALEDMKNVRNVNFLPGGLLCRLRGDSSLPNLSHLLMQAEAHLSAMKEAFILPVYPCLTKKSKVILKELEGDVIDVSYDGNIVLCRKEGMAYIVNVEDLSLQNFKSHSLVLSIGDSEVMEVVKSGSKILCNFYLIENIHLCEGQCKLNMDDEVTLAVFSPTHIVTVSTEGNVILWDRNNKKITEKLCGLGSEDSIESIGIVDDCVWILSNFSNQWKLSAYFIQSKKISVENLDGKVKLQKSVIPHEEDESAGILLWQHGQTSVLVIRFAKTAIVKNEISALESINAVTVAPFKGKISVFASTPAGVYGYSLSSFKKVFHCKLQGNDALCVAVEENAGFTYIGFSSGELRTFSSDGEELNCIQISNQAVMSLFFNDESDVLLASCKGGDIKCIDTSNMRSKESRASPGLKLEMEKKTDVTSILWIDDSKLVTFSPDHVTLWSNANKLSEIQLCQITKAKFNGSDIYGVDVVSSKMHKISVVNDTLEGSVVYADPVDAFTLIDNAQILLVIRNEDKASIRCCGLKKFDVIYAISVTESIPSYISDIEIGTTGCRKFAVLKVRVTKKEYEIVQKLEQKQNLPLSYGHYKIMGANLEKKESFVCYRNLTKIPFFANSWIPFKDSFVLIGGNRKIIYWNVDKGTCDQKMQRGTKVPRFFRPQWVETESNWGSICHGRTTHIEMDANQQVLIGGSEDGFVVAYDTESGLSVGGNLPSKKPQHSSKVCAIGVSPSGKYFASAASDAFSVWAVTPRIEIFSVQLKLNIFQISFSLEDSKIIVLGHDSFGSTKTLLFKLRGI